MAWMLHKPEVVEVPQQVVRQILEDGCCPLHLRLQLRRAIEFRQASNEPSSQTAAAALAVVGLLGGPSAACGSTSLASLLPLEDLLEARSVSSETLCGLMQLPSSNEYEAESGASEALEVAEATAVTATAESNSNSRTIEVAETTATATVTAATTVIHNSTPGSNHD
eukprot:TRINITY_DN21063_c0_g1_i1.p1 TRINITY_DN21063_c0_g1~~TRINITY_DN21063_c0_g1_i1.p1  ORF type:complete len:190 (+),score=44.95 TRINITY_DN21063_c0_g1_i1:71-571(+)